MPARKRPTLEDTATARQTLLDGLARDVDIFELVSELVPLHPRDNTFPGEVFLRLAADALDWCGASRVGFGTKRPAVRLVIARSWLSGRLSAALPNYAVLRSSGTAARRRSGAPRAGLWPWEAPLGAPAPSSPGHTEGSLVRTLTGRPAPHVSPGGQRTDAIQPAQSTCHG
jgi:hypothetical protein